MRLYVYVSETPANQCKNTHTVWWFQTSVDSVFDFFPKKTCSQISAGLGCVFFTMFFNRLQHRFSEGALGSFAELWIAPGGGSACLLPCSALTRVEGPSICAEYSFDFSSRHWNALEG